MEYTDKYLRLGEDDYPNHTLDYKTMGDYNDGGKFRQPGLFEVVVSENITVLNSDKYEWLSEVPLRLYLVDFQDEYIIPVGQQLVMFDNDTILVGIWENIFSSSHQIVKKNC